MNAFLRALNASFALQMNVCFSAAEVSEKRSESQLTSAMDLSADVQLYTVTQRQVCFDGAEHGAPRKHRQCLKHAKQCDF